MLYMLKKHTFLLASIFVLQLFYFLFVTNLSFCKSTNFSLKEGHSGNGEDGLVKNDDYNLLIINEHLSQKDIVISDFTQKSDEEVINGTIYLDRLKSRVVIDYNSKSMPLTIYYIGGKSFYFDKDTKETINMPGDFLLGKTLVASSVTDGRFLIEKNSSTEDKIELVLKFAKNPAEGEITIVFRKNEIDDNFIKEIRVNDIQGGSNYLIELKNYRTKEKIPDSIFNSPFEFYSTRN